MMLYPSHNVTLNVILMPLFLNGVSNDDHNKKKKALGLDDSFFSFLFRIFHSIYLFLLTNYGVEWLP